MGVFTKQLQKRLSELNQDVQKISNKFLNDFEILKEDLSEYLKSIQIQDDVKISEDFSDILFDTMNNFFDGVLSQEYDEIKRMLVQNNNSNFNYHCISLITPIVCKKLFKI